MVWRRFSVWSKTIEAGDSKTLSGAIKGGEAVLVVELCADFGLAVVEGGETMHELDFWIAGLGEEF
jgi:hypothetical protein